MGQTRVKTTLKCSALDRWCESPRVGSDQTSLSFSPGQDLRNKIAARTAPRVQGAYPEYCFPAAAQAMRHGCPMKGSILGI